MKDFSFPVETEDQISKFTSGMSPSREVVRQTSFHISRVEVQQRGKMMGMRQGGKREIDQLVRQRQECTFLLVFFSALYIPIHVKHQ